MYAMDNSDTEIGNMEEAAASDNIKNEITEACVTEEEVIVRHKNRSSFGISLKKVHLHHSHDQFDGSSATATPHSGSPGANLKEKFLKAQHKDLFFEIHASGSSEFKRLSLRELFSYIVECVSITAKSPMKTALNLEEKKRKEIRGKRSDHSFGATFLQNRDLRQLFSANTASEPSITVRKHVVLVNIESIRAIVLVDRVILQVQAGADSELHEIEKEILGGEGGSVYFEFRAYEALLNVSSVSLAREVKAVEPKVKDIVSLMEMPGGRAATSAGANDKFRVLLNMVSEMDSRLKARRRAFVLLLEEDEDLSMMNLTKMKEYPQKYGLPLTHEVEEDHEEVELMLESFLQEVNSIGNVLEVMSMRLKNVAALIQVKLDIARNRLLTASTLLSLVATCLGFGAMISGMFGMNLDNKHSESPAWFIGVAVSLSFTCVVSGLSVYLYLSRKGIWVS